MLYMEKNAGWYVNEAPRLWWRFCWNLEEVCFVLLAGRVDSSTTWI